MRLATGSGGTNAHDAGARFLGSGPAASTYTLGYGDVATTARSLMRRRLLTRHWATEYMGVANYSIGVSTDRPLSVFKAGEIDDTLKTSG